MTLRILGLVSVIGAASSAWAGDPPRPLPASEMAGKFAFGWTGHGKCKVIDSKQVKKLEHGFVCMPPDPNVGTASGKPLFALCKANKGRTELMVFATLADCREEYETQAANAD